MENKKKIVTNWFLNLRNEICQEFEKIEQEFLAENSKNLKIVNPKFTRKKWDRPEGGGGEISIMKGEVFEKVGVNISTVFGNFSEEFRNQIPGTENSAEFWASGISLVAHMKSPLVPAVHMNTRFICTEKSWFGGGTDLNPAIEFNQDSQDFHSIFKEVCDKYDKNAYEKYKKQCDEYFFIKHRNIPRGVGGIFYDYVNSGDFDKDLKLTKNVGLAFLNIFPKLVRRRMFSSWSEEQKKNSTYQKRAIC